MDESKKTTPVDETVTQIPADRNVTAEAISQASALTENELEDVVGGTSNFGNITLTATLMAPKHLP